MRPHHVVAGVVAGWLVAEAAHHVAARSALGTDGRSGRTAVLVLGFRDRGPRANLVNRWRVRAALRSLPADGQLIFSGGRPSGAGSSEAALMIEHAVTLGADPARLRGEDGSHSTWENVANSVPLLEDSTAIMIVSDPLHAVKARWYLARQRPDLARRLVPAEDNRFGERGWLKPLLLVVEGADLVKAWWTRPGASSRWTVVRRAVRRCCGV